MFAASKYIVIFLLSSLICYLLPVDISIFAVNIVTDSFCLFPGQGQAHPEVGQGHTEVGQGHGTGEEAGGTLRFIVLI